MKATAGGLAGVLVLAPRVFSDARGFFLETWRAEGFAAMGIAGPFVQDNHSRSRRGVLRGLHYQKSPHAQGKLVRVARGAVFDVVVDLRPESPTFRAWFGIELSDANHRILWAPPGLAHGFLTLSEEADLLYRCTDYFDAESDCAIRWDDPELAIAWPLAGAPLLSPRDAAAPSLAEVLG